MMNPKIKSVIAHLSPVGWIIALILNKVFTHESTSFFLRQTLGIYICFGLSRLIPDYYIVAWGFFFVFYTYSFIGTVKDNLTPVPFFGNLFQKWFRFIV